MNANLLLFIFISFFVNCTTSFYGYKISNAGKDLSLEVKKIPTTKKNILFLTNGKLDLLSDMLKRRGHTVTILNATEENLKKSKDYDCLVILKDRKYKKSEPVIANLFFFISLGFIPLYRTYSNDYEFQLLNKKGKQEITYSLYLTRLTGWLTAPVYWIRGEEISPVIPTIESYLLLSALVEE